MPHAALLNIAIERSALIAMKLFATQAAKAYAAVHLEETKSTLEVAQFLLLSKHRLSSISSRSTGLKYLVLLVVR